MVGIALKPLTVAFHEPEFIATLQAENQQPFWFMMSAAQRQRAGNPMGPANPRALNRYAYVLNNPLKWTDPSGHWGMSLYPERSGLEGGFTLHLTHEEVQAFKDSGLSSIGSLLGLPLTAVGFAGIDRFPKVAGPLAIVGLILDTYDFGGEILGIVDSVNGDRGVDLHFDSAGHLIGLGAPTVDRQDAIYLDGWRGKHWPDGKPPKCNCWPRPTSG